MWLDNDPEIGVVLDVVTVSQERSQGGQSPEDRPAELALKMMKMPGPRVQALPAEKTNWEYLRPGQGHCLGAFETG